MAAATLFCYIDPVSGMVLLQVICAVFLAVVAFFRGAILKVLRLPFRRKSADENPPDEGTAS